MRLSVSSALLSLLLFGVIINAQRECTKDDYTGSYTTCVNNRRNLLYYWKEGVQCSGGVPLPSPVFNLRCDIACGEGYYLPLGTESCQKCDPGYFSIGGGLRITNWDEEDVQGGWSSYCTLKNGTYITNGICKGWATGDDPSYYFSGNTSDRQNSILYVDFLFQTSGHVHFEYRVDAEPRYDVLIFEIDGVKAFSESNIHSWKTFQRNITKGYHSFQWTFNKDESRSVGEDAAFIKMFEVGGISYAQDKCTACGYGTFNNQSGLEDCYNCPEDTYNDKFAATECKPCPDDEYAYPGSSNCTKRSPCTVNDIGWKYSDCSNGERVKSFYFLPPVICDTAHYTLNSSVTLPCAPCNPGTFRNSDWKCESCPDGQAISAGNTQCAPCSAGTAARRGYNFQYWSEMPTVISTHCEGDCATNGFRLMDDYIDSGVNHGAAAEVTLSLENIVLYRGATVSFAFTMDCKASCSLDFQISNSTSQSFKKSTVKQTYTTTFPFSDPHDEGHEFSWTFIRTDPQALGRYDRVKIHYIIISGISGPEDSSWNCTTCLAGTAAPAGSNTCSVCPVGTSSTNGSATCTPCPVGFFNDREGQDCLPCGHGTTSVGGATECISNCTYLTATVNGAYTYDLSGLIRTDEMYGPIYDLRSHAYYINVCSKEHHNHTCYDSSGAAIASYACQITNNNGIGVDLGRTIGFYTYEPNPSRGIIVSYTHGTRCGQKLRSTNITFFCDRSAGVGEPKPEFPEVEGTTNDTRCTYHFTWNSTYGCPLCRSEDIATTYSQCINGTQTKYYYYMRGAQCHDGARLPAPEVVKCNVTGVKCKPGQFSAGSVCQDCQAGSYSTGGDGDFVSWDELPPGFTNNGFVLQNHSIVSGEKGTTSLSYTRAFPSDGQMMVTHRLIPDPADGTFLNFYMDGVLKFFDNKLQLEKTTYTVNFKAGTHTFKWEFYQGIANAKFGPHVSISAIRFNATVFASTSCTACPAGMYAPDPRSTSCMQCPINTYSYMGATSCITCDEGYYTTMAGSDECQIRPNCTFEDMTSLYTHCVKNNDSVFERVLYHKLLEPGFCNYAEVLMQQNETFECHACPLGAWRGDDGSCQTCSSGYTEGGKDECQDTQPGQQVIRYNNYFSEMEDIWPQGWSTNCSGTCTSAWRISRGKIDSGDQSFDQHGEIDSWVSYDISLITRGYISFGFYYPHAYTPNSILQFFIDGQIYDLEYSDVEFGTYVEAGQHTLIWNYYQPHNSRDIAWISNFQITGAATGIARVQNCTSGSYSTIQNARICDLCPAGSFSSEGATECQLCPVNTYANKPGMSECIPCGTGRTTKGEGSTSCDNTCTFTLTANETGMAEDVVFSLAGLNKTIGPVPTPLGNFYFSPCGIVVSEECSGSSLSTSTCLFSNKDQKAVDNGGSDPEIDIAGDFSEYEVVLRYKNGENCNNASDYKRSTELQMHCDASPSGISSSPRYLNIDPVDENPLLRTCRAYFIWNTIYGCPVCKKEEYKQTIGDCENGVQTIVETRTAECNGPATRSYEQACSVSYHFPLGVIIASVIAFIALFSVSIFIFVKHRRISNQYNRLQESYSARGFELEDNFQNQKANSAPPESFSIEEEDH